jgi:hypothetical protein
MCASWTTESRANKLEMQDQPQKLPIASKGRIQREASVARDAYQEWKAASEGETKFKWAFWIGLIVFVGSLINREETLKSVGEVGIGLAAIAAIVGALGWLDGRAKKNRAFVRAAERAHSLKDLGLYLSIDGERVHHVTSDEKLGRSLDPFDDKSYS